MITLLRVLLLTSIGLSLSGCISWGDARDPIGTILVPATQHSKERALVVVLPGFGNDAEAMQKHGIGEAIHKSWPQADVLLTSTTFAYYKARNVIERLDTDVIEPARQQGYKKIWLAGASVGGMGVLFYEYAHPGKLTGLVLLSPWLGGSSQIEAINDAGGVRAWSPGPKPETINSDNYESEMWRVAKNWSEDPKLASRVWLICGSEDRLHATSQLLAQALPEGHYVEIPGGHNWPTFLTAADRIITQMRSEQSHQQRSSQHKKKKKS